MLRKNGASAPALAGLLVVISAAVLLLSIPPAPAGAQAASELRAERNAYQQAQREGKHTEMARIVGRIAAMDLPEAADFLLSELKKDQDDRRRRPPRPGLPGNVRKEIIRGLMAFKDEESIARIAGAAAEMNSAPAGIRRLPPGDPILALDQLDLFEALAGMNVTSADARIRESIREPANPYLKVAAIEAVRSVGARRFVPDIISVLHEDNASWRDTWKIVPVNVFAALAELVEPGDTATVKEIVEAVLVFAGRDGPRDERVNMLGSRMLNRLTGEVADLFSLSYWRWWLAQMEAKAAGGKEPEQPKPSGRRSETAAPPIVFDVAPVGDIVFVIDVSDSMHLPLRIDLDEIERRRIERDGPVSGERRRNGGAEEVEEGDGNPLRDLPWRDIKTRLHLAREELSRGIRNLSGKRRFAIVVYSTNVRCITNGWVEVNPANKAKWAEAAKGLETEAMTNIHGALNMALRLNKKGVDAEFPAVDPECVVSGADTIIFLTDGWGSWDDQSSSRVTDRRNGVPNSVGDGPFIYAEDILPDILRINRFRKVVIHTVGIGDHDKDLMRALAGATGGKYTDWGFKG
jgi:hypothetical protein